MASSIFGGIANAIDGGPKLDRISYSSTLDDQLGLLTKGQEAKRAADAADLARLSGAATGAAKQIEGLSAGDMAVIQQIIQSRQDPFQTYTNVGNYNLGILNNLSANLANLGRAGESRQQAALGYGGRGQSTYGTNTLLDRISKNLSPVYASTIAGISPAATAIDNSRLNQNNNTVGLLDYRAGIPLRSVDAYGIPIEARSSVNADAIRSLLGLGEGYKTNTAGYREKQTALGNIGSALDSVVDTGTSLYSSGLFNGMLGGGAAKAPATQSYTPANFGSSGYGNFNMSYNGAPLAPQVPPSGYGQYGMSYNGAWAPPWRN